MRVSVVARQRHIWLVLIGIVALLVTLFAWGLGSPPAAGPDERFHYGFIWCPSDSVSDSCLDVRDEANDELRVRYAVPDYSCFLGQPDRPAKCSDATDTSETVIVRGAYPAGYYRFASIFVSSNAESSVLRIRLANSAIAALMIGATILLTRGRLRHAFIVASAMSLGPLHASLLSSTHHQSWSIVALTTGWALVLVAANPKAGRRRLWSAGFWLCGLVIAVSSRWEGGPYFVYLSGLALSPQIVAYVRRMRSARIVTLALVGSVVLTQIPNWPFSIRRWITGVNTTPLNAEGPDVWTWLTSWVVHFPSVITEIFGGGGMATDDIPIPSLGPTGGPLLLGGVCAFALMRATKTQVVTAVVQLVVVLLSILYFTNIELDLYTLPGRYVTPLVGAMVGLLIHQSTTSRQFNDHPFLRATFFSSLAVFHALALHAYVERFVVGSRPSIGQLDLTTESWWWQEVPLGPNQVVITGSVFFALLSYVWCQLLSNPPHRAEADRVES